MKKSIFLLSVLIFFSVCAFCGEWHNSLKPEGRAVSFAFAEKGKATCDIVIPEKNTVKEKEAAQDLAIWLGKIFGCNFRVCPENERETKKFISVGNTDILKKNGIKKNYMYNDGYAINIKGAGLYLFGDDNNGVLNAVYALLEEDMGCRFWNRWGEVSIPKIRNSVQIVPRTYNPPFLVKAPTTAEMNDQTFIKENRIHSYSAHGFAHTSFNYVSPDNFEAHPEWFSEINGERVAHQLCWSSEDVINLVTENLKKNIEAFHAESYNITPMDGYPLCECEKCRALSEKEGTKAAPYIKALNKVAENIEKEYPDTHIVAFAYLDYVTPPKTIKPHRNITVMVCSDSHDWTYPLCSYYEADKFRDDLMAWKETGADILTWNYVCNYDHFLLPNPNDLVIAENIRFLRDNIGAYKDGDIYRGITGGVFLQGGCYNMSVCASGYMKTWVWGKQLLYPDMDTKALMKDFIFGFYGKAAEPIYEYEMNLLKLWEDAHKISHNIKGGNKDKHPLIFDRGTRWTPDEEIYTDDFIENSVRLMDKALKLAEGDEILTKRVKYERLGPLYLYLGRKVGYFRGGSDFVRKDFDKEKKDYYVSLVNEITETLADLSTPTVAETFPTDNTMKYMSKWLSVLDSDSSLVKKWSVEKTGWKIKFDPENMGKSQ
ncbi:MAG: DUF4838 domain-containing protein, partial [Armatimonadetes bacterium]|nr:DUF4838 domain-containing protein [Candidatus Hippobium faecium]